MVWNAGLVLAAALAAFLGVREGLRQTLISGMDEVLIADVREVSLDVADLHATAADLRAAAQMKGSSPAVLLLKALNRKESVHLHNGWFVELLDGEDRRLWASDLTPNLGPREAVRRELVPVSWNGYRVVEQTDVTARGRPLRIRVGAPMDFIERDISSIDALAGRGVALLLVAAPLAGYWLAGRAVRPLAAIIKTTAGLRPNRMEERLPTGQTDDELDQLSRTVNQFLDRIAAYLSQSNDLLANSAHELRTPLAAIRSTVEVALGRRPNAAGIRGALERGDRRMCLARTAGQPTPAPGGNRFGAASRGASRSLQPLVGRCTEMFSAAAEARQIELKTAIEPNIEVVGFAHHLRQVVNNLLDNAIKFSGAGRNRSRGTLPQSARDRRASGAGHRLRDSGGRLAACLRAVLSRGPIAATHRGDDRHGIGLKYLRGDRRRPRGTDRRGK